MTRTSRVRRPPAARRRRRGRWRSHPPCPLSARPGGRRCRRAARSGHRGGARPSRPPRRDPQSACGRSRRAPPAAPARTGRRRSSPDRRWAAAISCIRSSPVRHSMPRAPWPTAGSISAGSSTAIPSTFSPSRLRPASASSVASAAPSATLRSRVPTLPRIGTMSISGRRARHLRLAAERSGPDPRTLRQVGKAIAARPVARDQHVARVLPLGNRRDLQPIRQPGRHVLHRVHREIDAPVQQRLLDLLGEEPLAADLGERVGQRSDRPRW